MKNSGLFGKRFLRISLAMIISLTFLLACGVHRKAPKALPPDEETREAVKPERGPAGNDKGETAAPRADRHDSGTREETSETGGGQQAGPPEPVPPPPSPSPAILPNENHNPGNPPGPAKMKSARMAYNFPSEMHRNESADINVYVSLVNSAGFVKDTLMKIVALQKDPDSGKTQSDSIVTANIFLYKRIKVELLDPDSAFRIKQVFGQSWQDVDSLGDNRWRWSVIPLTNHPEARLVIKVVAETPESAPKDIDDRTFYIRIRMTDPGQTARGWLAYLQDNPELFLTAILIPLIAFFGKRYFDRRSKRKDSEEG